MNKKILVFIIFFITEISYGTILKDKELFDMKTKGKYKVKGQIIKSIYFSPEKTCFFQIPPMKEGVIIEDKLLGKFKNELYVAFINPDKQRYQIDVYYYNKCKTAEDYFNFEIKKEKNKRPYLYKNYLNEKFDLFHSNEKFDVFIAIDRSIDNSLEFCNVGLNMAYILVKDRVYRILSVINWNDYFSNNEKKYLTDAELVAKGKEAILEMLSRFYVYLPKDREKIMAEFKAEQKTDSIDNSISKTI